MLYIEDDIVSAVLMQELVRAVAGCEIVVAPDATAGLTQAIARPPDVVISDLNLPGLSGVDFALAARAHPRLRDCRLIALTGDATPSTHERARHAGFESVWTKPLDVALLVRVLRELGAARPEHAGATPHRLTRSDPARRSTA